MQHHEPIPESVLRSEDFDSIKPAVFKHFKSSLAEIPKWAAERLSKFRTSPEDSTLGPIATKMLVYFATPPHSSKKEPPLEEKFILQKDIFWITRIVPYAETLVGSDCLFSLYQVRVLPPSFIIGLPLVFASFARAFTVHEFMSIKNKGRSLVHSFLEKHHDMKDSLKGLEELYKVYQSDFKYIISPSLHEIRLILEFTGFHRQIINFLEKTKLLFPALDNASLCLYEPLIEPIAWYTVKKTAKLTGIQQIVYNMSKKICQSLRGEITQEKREKVLNQIEWYLELAYSIAIKPKIGSGTFVFPTGFTTSAEFPLHLLPMEIMENILSEFQSDETVRAIFCLSKSCSQIKKIFDWRRFLKRQFPLKYHVVNSTLAENPKFKWNHYCSVQNRLRASWSQSTFSKFTLPGTTSEMDENLFVGYFGDGHTRVESDDFLFFSPNDQDGSFEMTNEHKGYYWLNWNDTKDCYKLNFFAPNIQSGAKACLIDSVSDVPKIALINSNKISVWNGTESIIEFQTPKAFRVLSRYLHHNGSLYVGSYEYLLDYMEVTEVFRPDEFVLDIGSTNDVMICGRNGSSITFRSKTDKQIIGTFGTEEYDHGAFLDDYLCAVRGTKTISVADLRKLDSCVLEIDLDKLLHTWVTLDGPNQRAISYSSKNSVVNVWNLKTGKWVTAIDSNQHSQHKQYLINARYFCAGAAEVTDVFDFNNEPKGY